MYRIGYSYVFNYHIGNKSVIKKKHMLAFKLFREHPKFMLFIRPKETFFESAFDKTFTWKFNILQKRLSIESEDK